MAIIKRYMIDGNIVTFHSSLFIITVITALLLFSISKRVALFLFHCVYPSDTRSCLYV